VIYFVLLLSGVSVILYMETPRDRGDQQQPPKQTTLVYICGGLQLLFLWPLLFVYHAKSIITVLFLWLILRFW